MVGRLALPRDRLIWRVLLGLLLQISTLIIIGSVVYLLHNLNPQATVLVIILAPTIAQLFTALSLKFSNRQLFKSSLNEAVPQTEERHLIITVLGIVAALGFTILAWIGFEMLTGAATELSIRSPWDNVPRLFFIIFFLVALAAFGLAAGRLAGVAVLAPIIGLSLLATTVAVTVYSVGFGFDSFIHQATENHIFAQGEMTPKPFYYLGQYALVTILARLLGGHVTTIDTWLVPLTFTLIIPIAYWSLRRSFGWTSSVAAASCLPLLALPLSSFVLTTPQGLANVWLILTAFVVLASATTSSSRKWLPLLLALATAAIHPLAGVPLLIFVLMMIYLNVSRGLKRLPKLRWIFFIKLTVLAAIALPLMFIINARLSGTDIILDPETIRTPTAIIEGLKNPELQTRRFSSSLDFVYFWRTTRTTTFTLLGLAGVLLLWLAGRKRDDERWCETAIIFAAGGVAFFINYVLLRVWVRFPFLIEYERTNYADRLAELTLFITAPLALYAFGRLLQRIRTRGFPLLAVGLMLLVAAVITANVYLAYPRRDKYESSRGWSTSSNDIEAVLSIDKDAKAENYAVLANQSVSAAAIRELGFKKYFTQQNSDLREPIFFYPIPTGGPLYQIFLNTNDAWGARTIIEPAFKLTGAQTVYYVVNHYWWQAQQIIVNAKREAVDWWVINDRVWVFKYEKK